MILGYYSKRRYNFIHSSLVLGAYPCIKNYSLQLYLLGTLIAWLWGFPLVNGSNIFFSSFLVNSRICWLLQKIRWEPFTFCVGFVLDLELPFLDVTITNLVFRVFTASLIRVFTFVESNVKRAPTRCQTNKRGFLTKGKPAWPLKTKRTNPWEDPKNHLGCKSILFCALCSFKIWRKIRKNATNKHNSTCSTTHMTLTSHWRVLHVPRGLWQRRRQRNHISWVWAFYVH